MGTAVVRADVIHVSGARTALGLSDLRAPIRWYTAVRSIVVMPVRIAKASVTVMMRPLTCGLIGNMSSTISRGIDRAVVRRKSSSKTTTTTRS